MKKLLVLLIPLMLSACVQDIPNIPAQPPSEWKDITPEQLKQAHEEYIKSLNEFGAKMAKQKADTCRKYPKNYACHLVDENSQDVDVYIYLQPTNQ